MNIERCLQRGPRKPTEVEVLPLSYETSHEHEGRLAAPHIMKCLACRAESQFTPFLFFLKQLAPVFESIFHSSSATDRSFPRSPVAGLSEARTVNYIFLAVRSHFAELPSFDSLETRAVNCRNSIFVVLERTSRLCVTRLSSCLFGLRFRSNINERINASVSTLFVRLKSEER